MPSLLKLKTFFKKLWAWCKKNWKFLVGLSIPLIIGIVAGRSPGARKIISRIREDYKKEIDVIDKSHEKELLDRAAATEKYIEVIEKVEEKYKEEKKDLDNKKRDEVKKILRDHKDDPDEITKRLSELTGFSIHIS